MTRASAKRSNIAPNSGSSISGSCSAASAINFGNDSSAVSSIFPAFFPNQGNEPDAAKVLVLQRSARSLRHFDQLLSPSWATERHDDAPVVSELLDESLGNVGPACC